MRDYIEDLRRFAAFCRKHSDTNVRVFDYNADDIEMAIQEIVSLREENARVVESEKARVALVEALIEARNAFEFELPGQAPVKAMSAALAATPAELSSKYVSRKLLNKVLVQCTTEENHKTLLKVLSKLTESEKAQ